MATSFYLKNYILFCVDLVTPARPLYYVQNPHKTGSLLTN